MEEFHWKMVRMVTRLTGTVAPRTRLTCVRNRGELAEGWYDPSTLQKAQLAASTPGDGHHSSNIRPKTAAAATATTSRDPAKGEAVGEDSGSDESVGPMLPGQKSRWREYRTGPGIPTMQDLELKKGMIPRGESGV
jgi:hypothetical protein